LFDRPKPTVGCSASGRRRRRKKKKVLKSVDKETHSLFKDNVILSVKRN